MLFPQKQIGIQAILVEIVIAEKYLSSKFQLTNLVGTKGCTLLPIFPSSTAIEKKTVCKEFTHTPNRISIQLAINWKK